MGFNDVKAGLEYSGGECPGGIWGHPINLGYDRPQYGW